MPFSHSYTFMEKERGKQERKNYEGYKKLNFQTNLNTL